MAVSESREFLSANRHSYQYENEQSVSRSSPIKAFSANESRISFLLGTVCVSDFSCLFFSFKNSFESQSPKKIVKIKYLFVLARRLILILKLFVAILIFWQPKTKIQDFLHAVTQLQSHTVHLNTQKNDLPNPLSNHLSPQ